jgi:hypothetical protein
MAEPANLEAFSEPLHAAQMMSGFPCSWCICGGWAIDLFVNRVSRSHKDIELAIWRTDQLVLRSYLASQGWTFEKAVQGQLLPWADSEWLELPIHEIAKIPIHRSALRYYSTKSETISFCFAVNYQLLTRWALRS